MAYLGRQNTYSECGFLIFNKKHNLIKIFFNDLRNIYLSNDVFYQQQCHDSWIFDLLRVRYEKKYNILTNN